MEKSYIKQQSKEVDSNYQFFTDELKQSEILLEKYGKFALLKDQKIIDYFDTKEDAIKTGNLIYSNKVFSVQEVTKEVLDLGYYSCAFV